MQDGFTAPVVGPSTIFPRGFLWQVPLWYGAAIIAIVVTRWLPFWYRLTAAGSLLFAMLIFLSVMSVFSTRAFHADPSGVRLGLPPSTRRRGRRRRQPKYLPWHQVDKVRIARRRNGARVELILSAEAPLALRGFRHGAAWRAWRAMLLLIPFWYLLRPTGVATPRDDPSRYVLRVRDVSVDQLRLGLRALAPPNVVIAVLVRKRTSVSSAGAAPRTIGRPA